MTRRCMDFAVLQQPRNSSNMCLRALMTLLCGCSQTVFSSIPPRLRSSGARPQIGLRVGTDYVPPASSVRDLGIYVDSDVSMRTHMSKTVSSCYGVLRQLRSIRRSFSPAILQSLVASLVLSPLDYCNATLYGLSGYQVDRQQSKAKAKAHNTCRAPQAAYRYFRGAGHVTGQASVGRRP